MADVAAALIGFPIYAFNKVAHKGKERIQHEAFKHCLRQPNADELILTKFPKTPKGEKKLHERLRWVARDAAQSKSQEHYLLTALNLPRVKDNLAFKEHIVIARAGALGTIGAERPNLDQTHQVFQPRALKKTLSEKIRAHGNDTRRNTRLIERVRIAKGTEPEYVDMFGLSPYGGRL